MAITHNFKEGIDWVADPTGETPLPNHIFVSKSGNDTSGDGSPQTPYKGVAKGCSIVGVRVVVGAGTYVISNIVGVSEGLIGDGVVIFKQDGTNYGFQASNKMIENVQFIGFSQRAAWGSFNARVTLKGCLLFDCTAGYNDNNYVSSINYINCVLINHTHSVSSAGTTAITEGCIVINSLGFINTSTGKFINTYFDENTVVESSGSGDVRNNMINGTYINTSSGLEENNIIGGKPRFNNVSGFDFSVMSGSELIGTGVAGANIGGVSIGKGYFRGVSLLDVGIDANVNIAYNSLGEIELQGGSGTAEVFETGEEVALELSVLGVINISGLTDLVNNTPDTNNALINPNQLILEINVAELDEIWKGYKVYRWNEQPTQNTDGTPNGDSSYNWADNNKVRWKKRKFRVTVRSNYNQA